MEILRARRVREDHVHKVALCTTLLVSFVSSATVCVIAHCSVLVLAMLRGGEKARDMQEHSATAAPVAAKHPYNHSLALFTPQGERVTHAQMEIATDPSEGKVIYTGTLQSIQVASSQDVRIDLTHVATPCRFRFISCSAFVHDKTLEIKEMQSLPAMRYAAISHVWASATPKPGILTGRGTLLVECEDRNDGGPMSIDVLYHTCLAALQEGLEYIWLDRLCILQTLLLEENVSVDKKWQIMRMHEIYQQCRVTLVLTAGLQRFPHKYEATGWVDRAWTFQEAMVAPEAKVLFVDYSASAESSSPPVHMLPIELYFLMQPSQGDDHVIALEKQQQFIEALRDRAQFRSNEHPDVLSRYYTIWRFVQWRSSARQADVVFSVMAMLCVSLDPSKFKKNDRFEAALALVQEMLRNDPARNSFLKIPLWSVINKSLVEEACRRRELPIKNVHDYMMRLPSIVPDIRQLEDVLNQEPIHGFYGTTTRRMPAGADGDLEYNGSMIPLATVNQVLNGTPQGHVLLNTARRVTIGPCKRLSQLAGADTTVVQQSDDCIFGWCIQEISRCDSETVAVVHAICSQHP